MGVLLDLEDLILGDDTQHHCDVLRKEFWGFDQRRLNLAQVLADMNHEFPSANCLRVEKRKPGHTC